MLHPRLLSLLLAVPLIAASGCGSGRAVRPVVGYQRNIGVATEHDIRNSLLTLLRRHGFDVVRYNGPPDVYAETQYRDRYPFKDEQELGVIAARNRVVLRARRVPQRTNMGDLYQVSVDLQNEVRTDLGEWTQDIRSPEFLQYAQRIMDELEHEVRSTVRVFDRG